MKIKQLLTKTLLVAVGLLVGASAWATATRTLFSQNYQEASEVDWTCPNNEGGLSLITSGSDKYLQYYGDQANSRGMYLYANNSDTYGLASLDNYTVQCDFYISKLPTNQTFQFVFLGNGSAYSSNNVNNGINTSTPAYLYIQENAADNGYCKIFVNDATAEVGTLTFSTGEWYTIKQVITKNAADNTKRDIVTTITDSKGASIIKSADGTSALDNLQTTAVSVETLGYFKGYYILAGRYQEKYGIDNIAITTEVDEEVVNDPSISTPVYAVENRTITITNGTSSEDNTVTTYYTIDGTDPSVSNYAGSFTTASKEVTITSNCTVKAVAISSTSVQSSIVNRDITVGKLTLNTPTITFTKQLAKNGTYYYPVVSISSDNSSILGTPTVDSYTATLNGNDITVTDNKITLTEAGKLEVYASAANYNKSAKAVFIGYAYEQTVSLDLDDAEATAAMGYTTPAGSGTYYTKEMNYYSLQSNITDWLDGGFASYNLYEGYGIWYGSDAGTGNQDLKFKAAKVTSDQIAHFVLGRFSGSNVWTASYTTHWGYATDNIRQTNSRMFLNLIELYSKANSEVLDAIFDCMNHETSSAFATYINGKFDNGDLTTAADVYAAHTAWQIEQAKASGSTDITKVIRDAAVADLSATDWNGANVFDGASWNEKYTEEGGAPDNNYFDVYEGTITATQTIYGVPAGTYTIKAATRGASDKNVSGNLWVYDGTSNVGNVSINPIGNDGGTLGKGWNWSSMTFTLTETKDLQIGFYASATESTAWAGCDDWHMTLVGVPATITSAGWATLYTPYALDFSSLSENLTAYTATLDGNTVKLKKVDNVPANTGVVLEGSAGNYSIPVTASSETAKGDLQGSATEATACPAEEGFTYYILTQNGDDVQFNPATSGSIAAGKAFLKVATGNTGGAKAMSVMFANDLTGIANVNAADVAKPAKRIVKGHLVIEKDGKLYNAAGAEF